MLSRMDRPSRWWHLLVLRDLPVHLFMGWFSIRSQHPFSPSTVPTWIRGWFCALQQQNVHVLSYVIQLVEENRSDVKAQCLMMMAEAIRLAQLQEMKGNLRWSAIANNSSNTKTLKSKNSAIKLSINSKDKGDNSSKTPQKEQGQHQSDGEIPTYSWPKGNPKQRM